METNVKDVGIASKREQAQGMRGDPASRCLGFKVPANAYLAYGLHIDSDIACPELPAHPQPQGNPDVIIRLLPPVSDISQSLENGYYEVRPGILRLAVSGVGEYLVEGGNRISIMPLVGALPEAVRLFLLGAAMSALLYQRGLFPLHGSAVETRWGAMAFVGAPGAGKSTLAAEFHRKGYRLLSDDICAVATTPEGLQVVPALARFRLCADAYERIGRPEGAHFDVDKFLVPMNGGYCPHPVPLRAIHILTDQEAGYPDFQVLRGFSRVQRLFENLYRPYYLKGQSTQIDLMRLAGLIAKQAAIATLSRPRDPSMLEALVGFLESAWAKCFASKSNEEKI